MIRKLRVELEPRDDKYGEMRVSVWIAGREPRHYTEPIPYDDFKSRFNLMMVRAQYLIEEDLRREAEEKK